ncbi:neurogenic differentiation factor 1 [Glossina fuscipes]|uniref:Neurogenic differentiation factor 1 n=1 Tax=Glossina fuscipes TaxID=7396 RepID=A0A9C6E0X6_9MUSC|nr:neurogenic differentiation factor 1 [Glossina fuscipes]
MPRRKRYSSPFEFIDDDFDEDNCSQSSRHGYPPVQRNAANARERARMRVLSSAFGRLKTKLPNIPPDTKLSKLDTLRLATMYIKQLKAVVEGGDNANLNGDHINGAINRNANGFLGSHHTTTQSMSWPFGFYHHHLHDSWSRDVENFKSRQIRLGNESYITHLQPNHQNHDYSWHSENSSPSHLHLSHSHEPAYQFCHLNHPETHSLRNYEQHGSSDQNLRAFTNYNNLTDTR